MPARAEVAQRTARADSEDEIGTSGTENNHDSQDNKRAKPVINRTTVSKVVKKRAPAAKKAPAKKTASKTKAQREALKDRTNIKDASDTEDVEELQDSTDAVAKPKSKKSSAVANKPDDDADALASKKSRVPKPKPAKVRAQSVEPMNVIPETQQAQDVSDSIEIDENNMDIDNEPMPKHVQTSAQRARSTSQQRQPQSHMPPRARSTSQQPRNFSRGRSTSDTERRVADSETKRKLLDMTQKYEDMRLKYESLQELGRSSAESNFEKLKRASDQKSKDANELISSLKKELSDLRKSSSSNTAENARQQSQIASLKSDGEKTSAEAKIAHQSLLDSQNEIKSLHAKLEAARKSAIAAAESAKAPGSAIKPRDRSQLVGNLDSTKQAALKEELYRDLTGLIINSIKRRDGEDEYSCIQTGRNGTLHFHLTVNNDSSVVNPKTPSGLSYEDAEFAYEPFFDEDRDRDLIDILPDYLTEEICFPRNHAAKFHTKVVDSMTKKVVVEE